MNIIVTVKQVPNTQVVRINSETGTMDRSGVPSIMNPEDKNALEAALCLRAASGGTGSITALSMGPKQAEAVLREALAMGADRAILLCDGAFAGADTLATAFTLSAAITKIKKFDVILCGQQAIDGDTAQVGPQLAGCLNIPQVTHVEELRINKGVLTAMSNFKSTLRFVEATPPALLTVTKAINKPRYKTMNGILKAFRDNTIEIWNKKDLNINPMRIGINGSPTRVVEVFTPTYDRNAIVHSGEPRDLADSLFELLNANNYIKA